MQTEKKLAITVFSFPPDKGNVETAADLNVFSYIFSVLERADQNHVRKHALEQAEANDPTNLVQNMRKDKKKPHAYIADTATANAQVRTLAETVRLDAKAVQL
ncbi:hypothetical protein OIU78_019850 [Salix suchowensis]|nr:hypothetical protein OIU78_019850 [Salix suchowensis]